MAFTIHMNDGETSTFCKGNGRTFALFTIMAANVHGNGIIKGDGRDFK
jgi:hypothetical protein